MGAGKRCKRDHEPRPQQCCLTDGVECFEGAVLAGFFTWVWASVTRGMVPIGWSQLVSVGGKYRSPAADIGKRIDPEATGNCREMTFRRRL